ncbi:hypothetical protein PMAYCL1PPCAC_13216, partial [Pristionchus mayeri]
AGGRLKYAGIEKVAQETAKIVSASFQGLFVVVTLPMNILLLVKMRELQMKNKTLYKRERMYLHYVIAITAAHIRCVVLPYAYPNTITTFTSPIALIAISKHFRNGIRLSISRSSHGSFTIESA